MIWSQLKILMEAESSGESSRDGFCGPPAKQSKPGRFADFEDDEDQEEQCDELDRYLSYKPGD